MGGDITKPSGGKNLGSWHIVFDKNNYGLGMTRFFDGYSLVLYGKPASKRTEPDLFYSAVGVDEYFQNAGGFVY